MLARMMATIKRAFRAAPIASTLLALSLVASLGFGASAALFWINRPPIAERNQPVAAWMSPRYVARSWGLPPEVVLDAIEAPRPRPEGPVSLKRIAEIRGVPVEEVIADLEAAITAFRATETEVAQ